MRWREQKPIVKLGIVAMALMLGSYAAVALVSVIEGSGAFRVEHSFSGKPSFFLPLLVVPVLVALVGIGAWWVALKIRGRRKKRQPNYSSSGREEA
jgi:hypothetical protein